MIVARDEKRKGSYDVLYWTEEQEQEPEGMPEIDRKALCEDEIPKKYDEEDVPRGGERKKKIPRRRRKKHVKNADDSDGHAKERETEVTRIMNIRNNSKPMEPYPRWERFARLDSVRYSNQRRDRIETGEKPTAVIMVVEQKEVSINVDLGPSWTNEECGYNLLSEYQLLRYGISVLKVASKDGLQLYLQDVNGRKFPIESTGSQF